MPKSLYTRNGIYWARFTVRGHEYRESLRTRSERVAERKLSALRQSVEDRVWHGAPEPMSWEAAVVSWFTLGHRAHGLGLRTFDRYRVSIGQCREWLEGKQVYEITVKMLKRLVADRQRRGVSNATIRRDLTAVSSVLAHAIDKDWIEDNPARLIDRGRFRERKTVIVLPRPDSLAAVFALGTRFTDMAELALATGMREEEGAGLEHDRIDRARMTASLETTKGGDRREVPLTTAAIAIIDRQPRHFRTKWVFWRGNGERFREVASQFHATVARTAQESAQSVPSVFP